MIGVVEAYMHLAYNLYLLGHNTEKNKHSAKLQNRLLKRLKNSNEFPGAYFESYVCAILIRAGFEVFFEDETDGNSRCDFTVTCKQSGKYYSVEAKAFRRYDTFGVTENTTRVSLNKGIKYKLHDALKKPSQFPRIIFIEVNLPEATREDSIKWTEEAVRAVQDAEGLTVDRVPTDPAFIIITNHPHQYYLEGNPGRSVVAAGYKIPDFGHSKAFSSLREMYYAKRKHIDIHNILASFKSHYEIPSTFDGSLPSETFHGNSERLVIGDTYFFEDIGDNGLIATVTSATVNKFDKLIYIGTDKGRILTRPISDDELKDYEQHPDTFFGVVHRQGARIEDPFELFEWMLNVYINTSKQRLLELMKDRPDIEQLARLSQEELAIFCCEGWVNASLQERERASLSAKSALRAEGPPTNE